MTTPDERTRNILQAGAFLRELREDDSLPEQVRCEAHRLLRHYPTVNEVRLLAGIEAAGIAGSSLLTTKLDSCWYAGYRFGPHTE